MLEEKGFTKKYFRDNKYDHINEILEEQEIREMDPDEIVEKGFIDKLIISDKNSCYNSFKIMIGIFSLISVILSSYQAAFGSYSTSLKDLSTVNWIVLSLDVIFFIDIVLTFFHEYKSQERYAPVRDIVKISTRYVKTTFILDLIPTIPFNIFLMHVSSDYL